MWCEDTFSPVDGHRCEPSNPDDGIMIVFFTCEYCGRTWAKDRTDTDETWRTGS